MDQNCILLPVIDIDKSDQFYLELMGFIAFESYYKTTDKYGDYPLLLLPQMIRDEFSYPKDRPKLFRLFYKGDILTLCQRLYESLAIIHHFSEYPGGYFMMLEDFSGNKFEVTGEFIESNSGIDPTLWPFYNRM